AHHVRPRATMGDDRDARDAEQRRRDIRVVVHPTAELAEPWQREEPCDLAEWAAEAVVADAFHEDVEDARHSLRKDVAGEAVGHADVRRPAGDVAAFGVPEEVESLRAA